MSGNVFTKDPDARLDYQVDWGDWLRGDTIETSAWTVPGGITSDDDARTDTTATIWLLGGTVGQQYSVVNRITTAAGRINDQTITIRIESR